MHERRMVLYAEKYQQYMDKLTHLLFIYSAVALFLMPITRDLFKSGKEVHLFYYVCYVIMLGMLSVSMMYAARLVLITKSLLPAPLDKYFALLEKLTLEGMEPDVIDKKLQLLFMEDLTATVREFAMMIVRKERYHNYMYVWGLMAMVPYLVCLIFHLIYEFDV